VSAADGWNAVRDCVRCRFVVLQALSSFTMNPPAIGARSQATLKSRDIDAVMQLEQMFVVVCCD
jgi:hypothetical protein